MHMPFASRPYLRRIATSLMLLAIAAFVQQGGMIIASQAAAFAGFMPQPAIPLSGAMHVHEGLAGHVHAHAGHNEPGHVHGPVDDHHDSDDAVITPLCSLGCTCAVMPVIGECIALLTAPGFEPLPHERFAGFEPEGSTRPPSTPSIA
jgi:hypothetical protein